MAELYMVLGSVVLSALAYLTFRLARQAKRDYESTLQVERYQLNIAEKAHTVTSNNEYANETRQFINMLADHAFDFELFEDMRRYRSITRKTRSSDINKVFKQQFGDDWQIAKAAGLDFAHIVLLSGREYAPIDIKSRERKFREDKREELAKTIEIPSLLQTA